MPSQDVYSQAFARVFDLENTSLGGGAKGAKGGGAKGAKGGGASPAPAPAPKIVNRPKRGKKLGRR